MLQMFIAVINENFDVAEESKRSRQASHYGASHRPQQARAAWIRKLNPYRWFKAQPKAIEVELPSSHTRPLARFVFARDPKNARAVGLNWARTLTCA